jgi:hypothetical protein
MSIYGLLNPNAAIRIIGTIVTKTKTAGINQRVKYVAFPHSLRLIAIMLKTILRTKLPIPPKNSKPIILVDEVIV